VELIRIGLKGGEVLFETNPGGQGNWEFFTAESPAKKANASKAAKISVDNIRIENLKLIYRNEKKGSSTKFTLTDLKMSRSAADDGFTVELRSDYNGQSFTLSGNTGLISKVITHQRFPFKLSGMLADVTFHLQGAVKDVLNLRGIDLQTRVSGKISQI
jgi:hypothetical protein